MPIREGQRPRHRTPHLIGLTPDDWPKMTFEVQRAFKELATRLEELENAQRRAGLQPVFYSTTPEEVCWIGALVHGDDSGVAKLAVASDPELYATDVVTEIRANRITCYSLGTAIITSIPFTTVDSALFLSAIPGYAADVPPDDSNTGWIRQIVGFKKGERQDNGECQANLQCDGNFTVL